MSSLSVSVVREPEKNSSSPIVRSDCVYKSVRRSKDGQYGSRDGSEGGQCHVVRGRLELIPMSDERFSSRPRGVVRTYSRYISRTRPPPPYMSRVVSILSFLEGQTRLRLKSTETKSESNSGCCCTGFRREFMCVGEGKISNRFRVRGSRAGRAGREALIAAEREDSESLSSAHDMEVVWESRGDGGSNA